MNAQASEIDVDMMVDHVVNSFETGEGSTEPFPHWQMNDFVPHSLAKGMANLELPESRVDWSNGERRTEVSHRFFFSPEVSSGMPLCGLFNRIFLDRRIVKLVQDKFSMSPEDCFLRVERCQDIDGFWLKPHVDESDKLMTLQIYLSDQPEAAEWGTDILDADRAVVKRARSTFNSAFLFIPAKNTWHGFERRPITGLRKSIIVNYVSNRWRTTSELANPSAPLSYT
ncbi:MAG: 2OG-Fe(II) oxygenase [Geminicoccaceae bacterium]